MKRPLALGLAMLLGTAVGTSLGPARVEVVLPKGVAEKARLESVYHGGHKIRGCTVKEIDGRWVSVVIDDDRAGGGEKTVWLNFDEVSKVTIRK